MKHIDWYKKHVNSLCLYKMRKIEIIYFIPKNKTSNASKFICKKCHKLLNL